LLALTLAERIDPSMEGLIRLVEKSLSDPRRLKSLIRTQSAILLLWALRSGAGKFTFEPNVALPPLFQACPLQLSLPALVLEGVRRLDPTDASDAEAWGRRLFARVNPRGGCLDRAGLSPAEIRLIASLEGSTDLNACATKSSMPLSDVVDVVRGLQTLDLVEERPPTHGAAVLVIDDEAETVRAAQATLGPDGRGCRLKIVHDRVGAQLLLKRQAFDLIFLALDSPEQEALYQALRTQASPGTRFVGIRGVVDESDLMHLDSLGLDGVIQRPVSEADIRATTDHLLELAAAGH
jgi:CheY-like chemotaxis protein